eukprot:5984995-Pyramimonas_sp.AAC.1
MAALASTVNMKAIAMQRGQLRTNRAVRLYKPASCVTARRAFAVVASQPKKVGVLMGSPNDQSKMKGAVGMLVALGLEADVRVLSAHRQPADVAQMALSARDNGYAAFICGAGMAAHLAGVVSAHTTLPVRSRGR